MFDDIEGNDLDNALDEYQEIIELIDDFQEKILFSVDDLRSILDSIDNSLESSSTDNLSSGFTVPPELFFIADEIDDMYQELLGYREQLSLLLDDYPDIENYL